MNIELIAPASFVSLAVPLAVFMAFQRYFVQGPAKRAAAIGVERHDQSVSDAVQTSLVVTATC